MRTNGAGRGRATQDLLWQHVGYSALPERAPIGWPDGKPVAVIVVVNVEHYEYLPPHNPHKNPYPGVPVHPDVVGYSYRDYGNRVGLWRMLEVLDEFDVPVTCSLNVAAAELYPEVREQIVTRDWAIMSHGEYNTRYLYDLSYEEEWALHARLRDRFEQAVGKAPRGLLGPSFTASPQTYRILAEQGMSYTMDWFVDDQPFPLRAGGRTIVGVPYSRELNDAFVMPGGAFYGFDGDYFAQVCHDQYEVLAEEGTDSGRVMTIALHPFYMGLPQQLDSLRSIFAAVSVGNPWWTTAERVADHYSEHYLTRATSETQWPQWPEGRRRVSHPPRRLETQDDSSDQ